MELLLMLQKSGKLTSWREGKVVEIYHSLQGFRNHPKGGCLGFLPNQTLSHEIGSSSLPTNRSTKTTSWSIFVLPKWQSLGSEAVCGKMCSHFCSHVFRQKRKDSPGFKHWVLHQTRVSQMKHPKESVWGVWIFVHKTKGKHLQTHHIFLRETSTFHLFFGGRRGMFIPFTLKVHQFTPLRESPQPIMPL